MSTKVTSISSLADLGTPPKPVRASEATVADRNDDIKEQADFRLIIEEGPEGTYIYKTLDRRTGEIVQQFPLEEVLRLKGDETYSAGAIITAKA